MENKKENRKDKPEKKQVKVINVPKKKKPLRTPSHIIRLCLVWSFVICIFLLTFPFLNTHIYITKDLKTTIDLSQADLTLATQEQIDNAQDKLSASIKNLKKKDDTESEGTTSSIQSLSTANYKWEYHIAENVNYEELQKLIQDAMDIDRTKYTDESVKALNNATINAQKTLCATVELSQTAFQMMLGGSISEAYGYETSTYGITQSFFAFALAVIPIVGFFAASFDKHRHIKHIICFVGALLCLSDIIFTIYPNIGIGAVMSIIMYFLICVLNIAGIYAKQQEDYIIKHPELEADFGEKHPHFVKALINEKTFGSLAKQMSEKERQVYAAKNAQKRRSKKK